MELVYARLRKRAHPIASRFPLSDFYKDHFFANKLSRQNWTGNKMICLRLLRAFIFSAIVVISLIAATLEANENVLPFSPGEKLTFRLKWVFIPVGEAVLEVLPVEPLNGLNTYHFLLTAKTNTFFDNLYKVRDRIDAYTDVEMTRSVLYKKKQREGKTKRDIVVNFNWQKSQAQYSNFDKKQAPIELLPGSFDPLSVFYFMRFFGLKKAELQHPVTDGKKCVIGKATVIKRETIKVESKTYDTYLIEPELKHIRGVFEKSKNASIQLWVTADRRHLPVKIKSKVVVGTFVGELVTAEGLNSGG